jgi:hypothetical protein
MRKKIAMIRTHSSRRQWLVRRAEDEKTRTPPVEPERWPDSALRDAVKLQQAGLRARERTMGSTPRLPVQIHSGFADCVKTTALSHAALKTVSKCSFTARKLRFFACFCLA